MRAAHVRPKVRSQAKPQQEVPMSHAAGHGPGVLEGENRNIALLISVLALFLAIAEMLGKSAQTEALRYNVEASNVWAFFQAKTIRKTTYETAAEKMEIDAQLATDPSAKQILEKQVKTWRARAARYESEPETGEGRKELTVKARALEGQTNRALVRYHNFEYASGAFQIAIVLASASLITGVSLLLWGARALGVIGLIFSLVAFFAPSAASLPGAH
jgi:hypothetical protein